MNNLIQGSPHVKPLLTVARRRSQPRLTLLITMLRIQEFHSVSRELQLILDPDILLAAVR